jgi:hypothetical protein
MTQTNAESTGPTGPRTPEGKAVSSRNAFKHGLASGQLIIDGERRADFEALESSLLADYAPADTTETLLVKDMAKSYWLKERAIRLQANAFNYQGDLRQEMNAPPDLNVLIRYQVINERAFHKALKTLQTIQKERKQFVSQKAEPAREFVSQPASSAPEIITAPPKTRFAVAAIAENERSSEDLAGIPSIEERHLVAKTA